MKTLIASAVAGLVVFLAGAPIPAGEPGLPQKDDEITNVIAYLKQHP